MDNRGLLFIPDISGFTQFIQKTEIDHSRFIIQELLEVLMNSNELQLQISEVEGDAILFYRFGEAPPLPEIYRQVQKMFFEFHRHLNRYSKYRICQCSACAKADELTLKVITHHGEFSEYTVKNFNKLIGKDVITAHQLMKNEIPVHEYWLVTDNLYDENSIPGVSARLNWEKGCKMTESGELYYHYSQIGHLKEEIPAENGNRFSIPGKRVKVLSLSREYHDDIRKLYQVLADIRHRSKWMDGLRGVDRISSPINQVGTSHHCILDKNVEVMFTSDFESDDTHIMIEETDAKRTGSCRYILEKIGDNRTRVTVDFYLKNNPFLKLAFSLFMKKKLQLTIRNSMENLAGFIRTEEAKSCSC